MQVINTDFKNGATVDLNFQQNHISNVNPDHMGFAEHVWYFKTSCDIGSIDASQCQLCDQRCQACSALVGMAEIYGHAAIRDALHFFFTVIPLLQRYLRQISDKQCTLAASRPAELLCSGLQSSTEVTESTVPYPCS